MKKENNKIRSKHTITIKSNTENTVGKRKKSNKSKQYITIITGNNEENKSKLSGKRNNNKSEAKNRITIKTNRED